jgi:hypothetical protein
MADDGGGGAPPAAAQRVLNVSVGLLGHIDRCVARRRECRKHAVHYVKSSDAWCCRTQWQNEPRSGAVYYSEHCLPRQEPAEQRAWHNARPRLQCLHSAAARALGWRSVRLHSGHAGGLSRPREPDPHYRRRRSDYKHHGPRHRRHQRYCTTLRDTHRFWSGV